MGRAWLRLVWLTPVILALGLLLPPSPASAHPGAIVFSVNVGVPAPIEVLVPADYGMPIDRITITAAPGFDLTGGTPPAGWQVASSPTSVTFSGGLIPANSPGLLFAIKGTATIKGQMIFPVDTYSPDGFVMHYTQGPGQRLTGVVVYAGVTPHVTLKRKFPWAALGGGVLLGIGVIGTAVLVWRRRTA